MNSRLLLQEVRASYARLPVVYDSVIGLALAIIAYRISIFTPGVIAMRFEWYVPTYAQELLNSAAWASHSWYPANFGIAAVYPTYIFCVWWHGLAAHLGLNAAAIDRLEIVIPFVASFAGMAAFCRRICGSQAIGLLGGVLFSTSPFLFYHTAAGHLPYTQSYALLPWALCAASALPERKLWAALVLALAGAFTPQPQAILFGLMLVAIVAYAYGGLLPAVSAPAALGAGFFFANAFWIVAAALNARYTIHTLEHLQPVNIQFYLAHSIRARDIVSALLLRDYNGVIRMPFEQQDALLHWPCTLAALLVPALSAYAIFHSDRRQRKLAVVFTATSAIFLILMLGPAGVVQRPILLLYEKLPELSLFKENYHFAFTVSVTLVVLACIGVHWLRPRFRGTGIIVAVAVCGWSLPALAAGDLSGWAHPDVPDKSWAPPIAAQDLLPGHLMMLPGSANLHPAGRRVAQDGVDPNLFEGDSFGSWLSLNPMGVSLLHRVHDDRLHELPDFMGMTGVRAAYVRDGIRAAFWRDNPYWDSAVLRSDGLFSASPLERSQFKAYRLKVVGLAIRPSVRIESYGRSTAHRAIEHGPGHWIFKGGLVEMSLRRHARRLFRAIYRNSKTRSVAVDATFLRGTATVHVLVPSNGKPLLDIWQSAGSIVVPSLRAGSEVVVEVYPVVSPFAGSVRVQPVAIQGFWGESAFQASERSPVLLLPRTSSHNECAAPRYSANYAPANFGGLKAIEYLSAGSVTVCPPKGELFRAVSPKAAVHAFDTVVLYDGDLTAIRALRMSAFRAPTPLPPMVRMDSWWRLPRTERPKLSGAVFASGSLPAAMASCDDRCKVYQPADNGSAFDNFDPGTGWVMGNVGSDWVGYSDYLDDENTFRFVATLTTKPFYWRVPCRGESQALISISTNRVVRIRTATSVTWIAPRATPDTRLAQHWYALPSGGCLRGERSLKLLPRGNGITAINALVELPGALRTVQKAVVSYDLRYGKRAIPITVQAPIQEPTSTVSDAALTPPTPEPTLSLATTGRIPEWKRPLPISADEINPAAIIIRSKAGKWEPIIVLPVNFDPQWRVYAYRQGTLRMFWWLCILDRRCPEASMAHFEVNGFANAWNLRADASGDLIAVYRPEVEYAAVKSIIVLTSVIAAILAAIAAVIARNRRHGEAK